MSKDVNVCGAVAQGVCVWESRRVCARVSVCMVPAELVRSQRMQVHWAVWDTHPAACVFLCGDKQTRHPALRRCGARSWRCHSLAEAAAANIIITIIITTTTTTITTVTSITTAAAKTLLTAFPSTKLIQSHTRRRHVHATPIFHKEGEIIMIIIKIYSSRGAGVASDKAGLYQAFCSVHQATGRPAGAGSKGRGGCPGRSFPIGGRAWTPEGRRAVVVRTLQEEAGVPGLTCQVRLCPRSSFRCLISGPSGLL